MIFLKSGVRIGGIRPETVFALRVAEAVYEKHGADVVVTSCIDGQHMPSSRHYVGFAVDLRTKGLAGVHPQMLQDELRDALGPDYDVILEGLATINEHIHLEFDPKR